MQKVSLLLSVPFLIWLFESCATLNHHTPEPVKVNNHPLGMCHAGATKTDEEYNLLDSLGVEWLRVDYRWDKIEKSPGEFSYASMDDYTHKAIGNNKKILGVLCYDTP